MGLVWRLGGFDGFDTFFFSLYKALRYIFQISICAIIVKHRVVRVICILKEIYVQFV